MHFLQICRCSGERGEDCNSEPASRSLIKASELYSVVAFTVIKGCLWQPFLFSAVPLRHPSSFLLYPPEYLASLRNFLLNPVNITDLKQARLSRPLKVISEARVAVRAYRY